MSNRAKRTKYNLVTVLALELITVISGLILPRLILTNFGSATNGLVTSVSQFISCVTLLRAGVGGVTRAALYKPLDEMNMLSINRIVKATSNFMRKLTIQYTIMLFLFAALYPLFVQEEFTWLYSFSMVLILGISTFFDSCFGISYQFLLQADNRRYIISIFQIVAIVANVLVAVFLIKCGATIHIVKLGSSLVFSIKPLVIWFYVNKKYKIDSTVEPDDLAISQRWDAFAHNLAAFVTTNSTVIILTVFSNIKLVSVFSVYNMVIASLRTLITSLSSGVEAYIGNLVARGEKELLKENFQKFVIVMFIGSAWIFLCVAFLITPFVNVYTQGVNDADYFQPMFGWLMAFSQFVYCVRLPYNILVDTNGHFKQTKKYAMIEALVNIGVSVLLVVRFNLVGVAFGSLISNLIRTSCLVFYSNKNYITNSSFFFFKNLCCIGFSTLVTYIIIKWLPVFCVNTYFQWFLYAIVVSLISFVIILVFYFLLFNKTMCSLVKTKFS